MLGVGNFHPVPSPETQRNKLSPNNSDENTHYYSKQSLLSLVCKQRHIQSIGKLDGECILPIFEEK